MAMPEAEDKLGNPSGRRIEITMSTTLHKEIMGEITTNQDVDAQLLSSTSKQCL